ncbi:MAG TPA: TIGR03435 family protein [Bryobacteraceae bacterium]
MCIGTLCGGFFFAVFAGGCVTAWADGATFEVASVTLASPDLPQPYTITGGPGTNDPSRFRAPRINLFNLLARAFGASTDHIVGPSWLRDVASANDFTVTATMPPETTKEEFQEMLRNLLVERFHLVFHHEMRTFRATRL